ncbi:hypothetical protein F5Y01DRAFT_328645 [Xylaria sp. FL0043]|nr:hypothetical protein F5Y01DRAFT_328645 [Xylaria sp. FL0043]
MATVTLSSRRFACDRCRGQKLRCLRERLDPDRCDRCLRADVECLTTPGSAARSQSTDLFPSVPRKRRHPGLPPIPAATYTGMDLLGSGLTFVDSTDSAEWPSALDSSIHSLDFGDGINDMDISQLDYQLMNTNAGAMTPPPTGAYVPAPPQCSPFDATTARRTPSQSAGKTSSDPTSLSDGVWGPQASQSSSPGPLGSCIHRLSSTNLSLTSQLSRIVHGPPKVTLQTLMLKSDESNPSSTSPVEDMMSNIRQFIEVLEELSRGPTPSATPSLSGLTSNGSISEPSPDASSGLQKGGRSIDITTLLLILSCYVQLLRLYVVLFTHIYRYLLEVAERDAPAICSLPNLGFGDFVLESGNLQATVFIQIATSLFEKVECMLGLPPELRVTTRAVDRGGLRVEDDFLDVIKSVLSRDEIGKPENGKGGAASLRKHIEMAMQLLRESIAP